MQLVGFLSFLVVAITAKPLVVENGAICENKATGFFVIDNTILSLTDSIIYKDTSEEDCLKTCSSNRDQFGRSILCSSIVYDHVSFTCTIYKDKSKPEGSGIATQAVGKRYFEKVCLTDEVPMECAEAQFIRADDSVLVGYARNVTLVESMEQCIAQCVKEKCKSAMYFYEEGECITNTESALSKPRSFAKEENDKVIYFQNGCLSSQVTETHTAEELHTTTPQLNAAGGEETESSEEKDDAVAPNTEDKSEKSKNSEETQISEEKEENHDSITIVPTTTSKTSEPISTDDENAEDDDGESEVTEANTVSRETPKSSEQDPEAEEKHLEDNEEYDEGASPEEEKEENADNEKIFASKNGDVNSSTEMIRKKGEKANYIKYKKHSNNFPSIPSATTEKSTEKLERTSEETSGLPADTTSPVPITSASVEEEVDNNGQLSHEDGEEPSSGYAKALKKKKILKIKSVISNLNGAEEAYEFPNYFSEWSDWTPCSKSGERQIRRRKCLDLRRCLGALMQVQNCPAVLPEQKINPNPIESVRSVIGVPAIPEDYDDEQTETVQSQLTSHPPLSSMTHTDQSTENVWSPWLGVCQQFASSQPCNNGEMIGFESRECIAKDPSLCEGPFFRYCTLLC